VSLAEGAAGKAGGRVLARLECCCLYLLRSGGDVPGVKVLKAPRLLGWWCYDQLVIVLGGMSKIVH
jgi:hypothetical protein